MFTTRTYTPLSMQNTTKIIHIDTYVPWRYMNPMIGIWAPRRDAFYQALAPDGAGRPCAIPTTPPPFLHTHSHPRPQPTTVWRNPQQHPQCDIATTTLHSPFSILHSLTPSPPKNATPKPVYLTLAHAITAVI